MQNVIEIVTYITNLSTKDVKTSKNHQENLGSMEDFEEDSIRPGCNRAWYKHKAWNYLGNVVLKSGNQDS